MFLISTSLLSDDKNEKTPTREMHENVLLF